MASLPGIQGNWTSVVLSFNLLISSPTTAFFSVSLVHPLTVLLPPGITSQISYHTQILVSVSALGKPNPRQPYLLVSSTILLTGCIENLSFQTNFKQCLYALADSTQNITDLTKMALYLFLSVILCHISMAALSVLLE